MNLQLRFLFLTLLLIILAGTSHAQRVIGVKWEVPADSRTALSQLQQYDELGISYLLVDEQLSPEVWRSINHHQFSVYGDIGIRFPIAQTFSRPDSALIQQIRAKAANYLLQPSVKAIGLFSYGAIHQPDFWGAVEPFIDQLRKAAKTDIYFTDNRFLPVDSISADFLLFESRITANTFKNPPFPGKSVVSAGGFVYSSSDGLNRNLRPFKQYLEATAAAPETPVFVHSGWLNSILAKRPRFSNRLRLLAKGETIFPLSKKPISAPDNASFPIIILLVVWGTIALHYGGSPLYRKSLFRYFFGHKFFIDDILRHQIRSPLPALQIIIQHALLLATTIYVTFSALFSPLGQEAFFHYFPSLVIAGNHSFSIFLWVLLGVLLLTFVKALWLFGIHKEIRSLTQVLTIYAWPLQINFIIGTIAITLYSSGAAGPTLFFFSAVAAGIFFLSFILTSLDAGRYLKSRKLLYLSTTSGIYLLITGALVALALYNEVWIDVLNLSLNIK